MIRNLLILSVATALIWYLIWQNTNPSLIIDEQAQYDKWYDKWYDEWMCNIARTITGYEQCIVKAIQIGTGRTTKVTISIPEWQSPEDYNTILK